MRNTDWLDDLARSLSHGLPRRGALRAATAALMAGLLAMFSPSTAPTKRNKHKHKHKNNNKLKHKRRKKRKDRGKSQPTGSCTIDQTADASVLLVEVAENFEGKPLTVVQRATVPSVGDFFPEPDALTTTLDVRLAARPVIKTTIEGAPEQPTRVHVLYGDAFTGIRESIALNDGAMVSGEIDGRRVVPRRVEDVQRDPSATEFEDGNPPPVLQVDAALVQAIQALIDNITTQAEECARRQSVAAAPELAHPLATMTRWFGFGAATPRAAALPSATTCSPFAEPACDACLAGCLATEGVCLGACAGGCAFAGLFYGLCMAGCVGACYFATYECTFEGCYLGACCPVECSGSCCCEGETCCSGRCCPEGERCSNTVCCEPSREGCGSICCDPDESCQEGMCCPTGRVACAGSCCPNDLDICQSDVCCPSAQVVCDGVCCDQGEICDKETQICCLPDHAICDGVCCKDKDAVCLLNPDLNPDQIVCCSEGQVCGDICCSEGSECLDPETGSCCSTFLQVECGKVCCHSPDVCIDEECCPFAQACGERCCPEHHYCAREREGVCEPCPNEIDLPCPIVDDPGMPNCCPPGPSGNPQCCGNGVCCAPGTHCCGFPPECREICVE